LLQRPSRKRTSSSGKGSLKEETVADHGVRNRDRKGRGFPQRANCSRSCQKGERFTSPPQHGYRENAGRLSKRGRRKSASSKEDQNANTLWSGRFPSGGGRDPKGCAKNAGPCTFLKSRKGKKDSIAPTGKGPIYPRKPRIIRNHSPSKNKEGTPI